MLKKIIMTAILGISLTSFNAMAETELPEVQFDAEELSIDLKWDASKISDKVITVTVDRDGEISSDNCPDFAWVYSMPEDKQVKLEILLPPEMKSGTYRIYVDTKTQHHSLESFVYNIFSDEAKSVCEHAYNIGSVDDFKTYAVSNAAQLGLDTEDEFILENIEKISSLLFYEMLRHEEQTPVGISKSAEAATGFVMLGKDSDLDKTVNSYGDALGIDKKSFSEKTPAVKNKFASLVASKDNSERDIKSVIAECLTLASLTDAENWDALKESLTVNASLIGIDMGKDSKFASIPPKRQYEVFVKLFETSSKLTSYSEFAADFSKAVDSVCDKIKAEEQKNNNSSGGGGGGSSSSVSVSGGFLSNSLVSPSVTPVPAPSQAPLFNDIEGHFSEAYISELAGYNAVNGYEDGSFRPDGLVTRAEFVAMAVRTFSVSPSENPVGFGDVAPADWYYGAVQAMASNNIVNGYNGNFNPAGNITRQEAAVIVSNLMKFRNIDVSQTETVYADSSYIADWAKIAVGIVTDSGIMQGSDNMFRPFDSITRGETAVVIARLAKMPGMVSEVTK